MSFGWMSSEEDVQAIITFLKACFLDTAGRQDPRGQNLHGHNPGGQNPHGQNPTSTLAASVKGNPAGQSPIGHNPNGHNPCGHNRGLQDPSFSLTAHCSTAVPSAADSSHPSSVHSTGCISPVSSQGQGYRQHSQHTQSSGHPLQGASVHHRTHIQSAELQTSHTISRTHAQSEAEPCTSTQTEAKPHTSAQEVAVQHSKRCAWLRQLPWVRCGDEVTAWPASLDESQRLTPTSPNPSGGQHRGRSGGLAPDTSAPCCRQSAESAHSPSESALESSSPAASQSVLHSDFQHHSESQPCCNQGGLEGIWVYPIKSCGGIRVLEWPLGPNGLLLDREWALVGDDGHVLTQKGLSKLALVQPRVDLWQGFIEVGIAYSGNGAACCLGLTYRMVSCRYKTSTQWQNRLLLEAA